MTAPAPTRETIYSGPEIPPPPAHAEASPEDLAEVERHVNSFLVHVFAWIVSGLLVSALFASYSDQFENGTLAFSVAAHGLVASVGAIFALAFAISRNVSKMTTGVAAATLIAYAAIQGLVFGVAYRASYDASLAPVYLMIGVVFAAMTGFAAGSGRDLTSLPVLASGAILAPVTAFSAAFFFGLPTVTVCAEWVGCWLMLALVGYHRNFLRDLPSTFDDDPKWWKAAAIGAVQIYLDLVIIVVVVIQTRWLSEFFSKANTTRELE